MKMYEFKATNLIAKTFEEHEVKFQVINMHGYEEVLAGFPVDNGPKVIMKFISRDNDNDVAVRIFGLVTNTSEEKRERVMKACNYLNRKVRHMKFYVDSDGDINMEYDFPVHTSDDCVGEMAFEIFIRSMRTLDSEYKVFTKALYTDEDFMDDDEDEHSIPDELLRRLEELKNGLEARLQEHEVERDDVKISEDEDDEVTDDDFMAFLRMLAGESAAEEVA